MSDISKNIKRLRLEKRLTQDQLAETLHVTRQAVSNWETGRNTPDLSMLEYLAQAFEVEVGELLYPPASQGEKRRKIAVALTLAGAALLQLWATNAYARFAAQEADHTYILRHSSVVIAICRPLLYLLLGAALGAVVNCWNGLPKVVEKHQKQLLLFSFGAAALMLLPLLAFMGFQWSSAAELAGSGSIVRSFDGPLSQLFLLLYPKLYLFLPIGFLLFCGLAPKRG